jgi:adenosine deaminase
MRNDPVSVKERNSFKKLLIEIPKAEIHLHLEGIASVDTIWDLIQKYDLNIKGVQSKADLKKKYYIKSLDEFISLYMNVIQDSFKEIEDLDELFHDAGKYLNRNNIVYSEIFFAPSRFLLNGFSFKKLIQKLTEGSNILKKQYHTDTRFIIDVSRSFGIDNAMKNCNLTLKYLTDCIVGIGLGGSERHGPAKDYEKVFKKAAKNKLHVVAHAGEDVGPESIWDAVKHLTIERIGHGISAIFDTELMQYLADQQIPLEVCPTSNLITKRYATRYEDHPIKVLYEKGVNVTLNSDDPALFGADLVDEYLHLLDHGVLSMSQLLKILKNTIYATFLSKKKKDTLWAQAEKIITANGFTVDR